MTIEQLFTAAGEHWVVLIAIFLGVPAMTWTLGKIHGDERGKSLPWNYVYSALVYAISFPGIFATIATGFLLFFQNENLMTINVLTYILPPVSMAVTLALVHKNVGFENIPGFGRLSGFFVLIGFSFIIALAIQKLQLFVFFGTSVQTLFVLSAFAFAMLKWGSHMAFRKKGEEEMERPKLSGL